MFQDKIKPDIPHKGIFGFSHLLTKNVTIANGASVSEEVDVRGYRVKGIIVATGWTTAVITFQNSTTSGGTFRNVYDDYGTEVATASLAENLYCSISSLAESLVGLQFIKIRSGTAASAVNQSGGDTITLVLAGM